MATSTSNEVILTRLLKARTSHEILDIIESDIRVRRLTWVPFNRSIGNKGQIKLGKSAIRALVERVTNSFDAVVERRLQESKTDPNTLESPSQAVMVLFPPEDDSKNRVLVEIDPSNGTGDYHFERCTVDVVDYGTGIAPEDSWNTILSLSKNNKITKRYTIGIYGQGGATSIGKVHIGEEDSGYVVIASRTDDSPLWFTIIRFVEASQSDYRGYYECLMDKDGEVLSIAGRPGPELSRIQVPKTIREFAQGTLVRHFGYDLSAYNSKFRKEATGCLNAFNTYMFRPQLLFHMNLLFKSKMTKRWEPDKRVAHGAGKLLDEAVLNGVVEYAAPPSKIPIVMNHKKMGDVWLRYYVLAQVANRDKVKFTLTNPAKPVLGIHNGQTQDERSLDDLSPKIRSQFPLVCGSNTHDLVVEISVDDLSNGAKDNLLSPDRENFTDSEYYQEIRKVVSKMILEDTILADIDSARYEKQLGGKTEASETASEAKLFATDFVKTNLNCTSFVPGGTGRVRRKVKPVEPIVLQKTAPTFIRMLVKEITFNLLSDNSRYFMLETDAPNGYRLPDIFFDGEGAGYMASEIVAPPFNGRMRIRIDMKKGAHAGWIGDIHAQYSKTVQTEVPYEIVRQEPLTRTPHEAIKGTGTMRGLPTVTCLPIDQSSDMWNNEDAREFAYRAIPREGELLVQYSVVFPPYLSAVDGMSEAEQEFIDDKYRADLTASSLFLHDSGVLNRDMSPESRAERRASAAGFLMAARRELLATMPKKQKAQAVGA